MSIAGQMILVAGPYRSGTGDDPEKMAANVHRMEAYALPLFRAGHLPVLGEWLAFAASCHSQDQREWETTCSIKYSIPFPSDCLLAAMACCAWAGRRKAQT